MCEICKIIEVTAVERRMIGWLTEHQLQKWHCSAVTKSWCCYCDGSGVATFVRDCATPSRAEDGLSSSHCCVEDQIGSYVDQSEFTADELAKLDGEGRCVITEHQIRSVYCKYLVTIQHNIECVAEMVSTSSAHHHSNIWKEQKTCQRTKLAYVNTNFCLYMILVHLSTIMLNLESIFALD